MLLVSRLSLHSPFFLLPCPRHSHLDRSLSLARYDLVAPLSFLLPLPVLFPFLVDSTVSLEIGSNVMIIPVLFGRG